MWMTRVMMMREKDGRRLCACKKDRLIVRPKEGERICREKDLRALDTRYTI